MLTAREGQGEGLCVCIAWAECAQHESHRLTCLCSPAGLAGGSNGCAQSEFLGSSTTSRPGSFEDLEEALSDTLANGHLADSQPESVERDRPEPVEQGMPVAEQPPVTHTGAVLLAGALPHAPATVFASLHCLPGRLAVDPDTPQA